MLTVFLVAFEAVADSQVLSFPVSHTSVPVNLEAKMSNRRYTSEEAYMFLSITGTKYDPVDSNGILTDSSDDGVVVPAKVRHTRPRSFAVVEVQEPQGSCMKQRASTSAAHPSGELASNSSLVHPGRSQTSTAVSRGDVVSPISAVQAVEVASTTNVLLPPRRQR
ncbi:hypothetical protein AB205_0072690 [Aquarana catesbeiana]|uniref:Uncharacterized protein n=1 Tax=Aquarana catesbeiana TaxID=8400 RepID=A0A2G9QA18_AQUCT|nr:hypothetical protein AB205_0072690 [Aquarana catesbeiana]